MSKLIEAPSYVTNTKEERTRGHLSLSLDDILLPSESTSHTSESRSPLTSHDDLSLVWSPMKSRPSVKLVSRSARKWKNIHESMSANALNRAISMKTFEPWDYSAVASATDEIQTALDHGRARAERPPREGVNGTYFIRRVASKSSVLCVFKPIDEEAEHIESFSTECNDADELKIDSVLSMSNYGSMKRYLKEDLNNLWISSSLLESGYSSPGFYSGEGAYKEVAAYLLDHDNFARVPQTALASCNFDSGLPAKNEDRSSFSESLGIAKMGAFQIYVSNVGDADDFGPGVFSKDQVHQIAILDIRTLNHDRHGGNILVVPNEVSNSIHSYDLIPIDHGYILPDVVKNIPWPIWMDWSLIREPMSEAVKSYIARLDAESEALILDEELEGALRRGSLRSLKIATSLLQKASAAGLSLYEIGTLIYTPREFPDSRSELQKVVEESEEASFARNFHLSNGNLSSSNQNEFSIFDHVKSRSSASLTDPNQEDSHIEDFILKYARKRISELIRDVKENRFSLRLYESGQLSRHRPLGRARSIPDFGLAMRPMNQVFKNILGNENGNNPQTPSSSPVQERLSKSNKASGKLPTPKRCFSASICEKRSHSSDSSADDNYNKDMKENPIHHRTGSSNRRGLHRRIASERRFLPLIEIVGHDGTKDTSSLKSYSTKQHDSRNISGSLPPLFKK